MMNKRLLVSVALAGNDFTERSDWFLYSIKNFWRYSQCEVFVLFVCQGTDFDRDKVVSILGKTCAFDCIETHQPSLSAKRNVGVKYAHRHNFDFCYFQDSFVYCSESFVRASNQFLESRFDFMYSNIEWSDYRENEESVPMIGSSREVDSSVLRGFLWRYFFRVHALDGVLFNESVGVGADTRIQAAEDSLFLLRMNQRNPKWLVSFYPNSLVFHPPRPSDFSKHVKYSYAQAVFFRYLIGQQISVHAIAQVVLFFGNAIYRYIRCLPNSKQILLERIKGFCDFKNERSIFGQDLKTMGDDCQGPSRN